MTSCEDVQGALAERRALSGAMLDHVAGCPVCAGLLDATGATALPDLDAAVVRQLAQAGPVAAYRPMQRLAWPAGVLALVVLLLGARGRVTHPHALEDPLVWATGSAMVLLALVALWSVFGRQRHNGLPLPLGWRGGALLALLVLFPLVVVPLLAQPWPDLAQATWNARTLKCLVTGTLLGGLAGAAAFWSARRTLLQQPGLTSAVLGGACAYAGLMGLHLSCDLTQTTHLLVGHGGALLLLVPLFALGLRRTLGATA
jgi:hypothetical protein